ncbi:hypothetical protein PF010_g1363 [Phytophthora fragariae]|uniref:Uncharacterized protein n=1 Tax=Phytophthora fragariae TaxID=53985 RepID=A0A6G0M0L4_9STRA|nr:hypothetical protein PF010_g1363 [Phytophthora fragariae]
MGAPPATEAEAEAKIVVMREHGFPHATICCVITRPGRRQRQRHRRWRLCRVRVGQDHDGFGRPRENL